MPYRFCSWLRTVLPSTTRASGRDVSPLPDKPLSGAGLCRLIPFVSCCQFQTPSFSHAIDKAVILPAFGLVTQKFFSPEMEEAIYGARHPVLNTTHGPVLYEDMHKGHV